MKAARQQSLNVEYTIRELPSEPSNQWGDLRFSPMGSSIFLNDLAKDGWVILPGSIFSTTVTQREIGPSTLRSRVYAVFTRPLGNGAIADGA